MNQIINVDVYNQDVMIHFGAIKVLASILHKYMKQNLIDETVAELKDTTLGRTLYKNEYGVFIVYMPEKPEDALGWGSLIHELSHVTNGIMEKAGIPFSHDTEEAYTYLLGFLAKQVIEKFSISFLWKPSF